MTPMTETTRRALCQHLANLKAQKKMPGPLKAFESVLEDHLEELRKERETLVAFNTETQNNVAVYRDAYENQKTLTRNACVYDRERWDELYQLRGELESVKNDREECHDKLQEATAKLARQTQTIIALHRAIKDQQKALAASQELLEKETERKNRLLLDCDEWKEQYDRKFEAASAAQRLAERQRISIELLTFELVSARNKAKKPSFWRFLWQKKAQ